jgi:predicted NAD/FAD-binding protein
MSFGVSDASRDWEWGSYSFYSFAASFSNLLRPWFWRLLFDAFRFRILGADLCFEQQRHDIHSNHISPTYVENVAISPEDATYYQHLESIGDYCTRMGYSELFITHFLVPMVAAPWCIDPVEFAASFPAIILIRFM